MGGRGDRVEPGMETVRGVVSLIVGSCVSCGFLLIGETG